MTLTTTAATPEPPSRLDLLCQLTRALLLAEHLARAVIESHDDLPDTPHIDIHATVSDLHRTLAGATNHIGSALIDIGLHPADQDNAEDLTNDFPDH